MHEPGTGGLTLLDDFLEPLQQGVWEVTVSKESFEGPPDAGWEASAINVPSPGTVASYRKGQYHAHETRTEWRVHLDRYDPKVHPLLHLADDAPLVLMIGDTFFMLVTDTRSTLHRRTGAVLEEQKVAWQLLVVGGCSLILMGALFGLEDLLIFAGFIRISVPAAIIGLAALILRTGITLGPFRIVSFGRTLLGWSFVLIGIIAFFLPLPVLAGVFALVLAVWAFSSALLSLRRIRSTPDAVPEGFARRLTIGLLSLLLAVLVLLDPLSVGSILVDILGVLILVFGFYLLLNGLGLRGRVRPGTDSPP
jgi:hypothetical protein